MMPTAPDGTAHDDEPRQASMSRRSQCGNVIRTALVRDRKRLATISAISSINGCQRLRQAFVVHRVSVVRARAPRWFNNNMIRETPSAAVVGIDHARAVTTDLSADGAPSVTPQVVLEDQRYGGNRQGYSAS